MNSSSSPRSSSSSSSDANSNSSLFVSEASAERLAAALCRMRGAALKLGQMLSIQDDALLPPALASALARARAGADIMPRSQLEAALGSELGPGWRERGLFEEFDDRPMAAASIGQVHRAMVVLGEEEEDGEEEEEEGENGEKKEKLRKRKKKTMAVAVKVQYPGVAESVVADVDNLLRVASLTGESSSSLLLLFFEVERERGRATREKQNSLFFVSKKKKKTDRSAPPRPVCRGRRRRRQERARPRVRLPARSGLRREVFRPLKERQDRARGGRAQPSGYPRG